MQITIVLETETDDLSLGEAKQIVEELMVGMATDMLAEDGIEVLKVDISARH